MSADEVASIFTDAGWQPSTKDGWKGSFTWSDGVVVGGIDPWGTMRATSNAGFGMTLEEAAAWLVEHARERAPVVLTTEATLDPLASLPEEQQSQGHEGDGETGAEAQSPDDVSAAGDPLRDEPAANYSGDILSEPIDAEYDAVESLLGIDTDDAALDFTEDPLLEFGSEDEHPEHASGAFIFGDNLDQKRTAAIGLVMQAALAHMPAWSDTDTARLSELRNFAMGVSEGRWNDDPGSRQWLEELETRLRRRSQIVSHRDGLVEHLNSASREEIEAFDPEAGWPE